MRHGPALLACCAMLAAGTLPPPAVARAPTPQPLATPQPYLDPALLPDGGIFLAPPPRAGSPEHALDQQVFLHSRALQQQDPARWALATSDARLDGNQLLEHFGCALGVVLDQSNAPSLVRLLGRASRDTLPETDGAKSHFAVTRPYIGNDQPICVARHTSLERSPAYPSGHATLGLGIALILAEIAPDRSTALLARGRSYGESRLVCGVHWLSDVQAGYLNAAALVAVLHSSADFRADLAQARDEVAAARKQPATPPDPASCAAEHDAEAHSLLFRMQP